MNPVVKLQSLSEGDTTGCTFGGIAYWGDDSKPLHFKFIGGPSGTIFRFASHKYNVKARGTYTISVSDSVLAGGCTWGDFTTSFTLGRVVQCVYLWPNHLQKCSSTDPTVKIESLSGGDTTTCSFGGTVNWDDRSKLLKFKFKGAPDGFIFRFAHHAYKTRAKTYLITVVGNVLSGPCTWGNFTLSFKLTRS